MLKPRFLEGELFLNNGFLWIVKGYQHPFGKLIAFPRYSLFNKTRLDNRIVYDKLYYWDCLKIETPVIDIDKSYLYIPKTSIDIDYVVKTLSEYIGFNNYYLTGSIVINKYFDSRDLDIVIYGFRNEYVSNIEKLIGNGVLKQINYYSLYNEYLSKHSNRIDFNTYFSIKKNTLLHFIYRNLHINLRLVKYEYGFQECVDPVIKREFFIGEVFLKEIIDKYTIPSKYIVEYNSEEYYLESFRELYAELPRGKYFINGFLEYRKSGLYIIPDQGYIVYMSS